ncbi:D-inositol-3-phosphate glycosyltransferase [Planctomycetes bacterium Poly30]|uniref:D-inositol-3-phosphate glycosyltransferase n=1 Tax=Saltatorellus ferox TaxID=2528018 RepID=A0A518EU49_9BACT|nr:D-inositol-3-phosphate glycosyltransferase [Planctomycetes bacterium Poly30]
MTRADRTDGAAPAHGSLLDATVALDYTSGPGHAPGVGRYVRELVRALVRLPARNAFPLELLEVGRAPRPMEGSPLGLEDAPSTGPHFSRRITRLPRRAVALGERAPRLARLVLGPSRRAGLLHRVAPDWPPLGAVPFSIAVAEFAPPGSAAAESQARSCLAAAGVIVFSADAAARVESLYGVPPDRIFRSPVGSEHWQRDLEESSAQRAVAPPPIRPTRDILVLGAIRAARFPVEALAAFDVLRQRRADARLLFVGRPGDAAAALQEAVGHLVVRHGQAAVRWIDEPEEARMPRCVAGATLLLHLAEDEASPVTPLEAARMGLPLIASKLPAFEEVLGESAGSWFVSESDPVEIADALELGLAAGSDPEFRRQRADSAKPFTWEAAALAHCAAWKRMLGRQ